jgi:hypothetical protein
MSEWEQAMSDWEPGPPTVVTVEVWPVAADEETGVWLLDPGGAWPSLPVTQNSDPHEAAELELIQHQIPLGDVTLLHSTSWRAEGTAVVLTYLAVIKCPGLVLETWPDALPVTPKAAKKAGPPPTHAPTQPPTPRDFDVFLHSLRHARFLLDHDATIAAALGEVWRQALAPLEGDIARMYSRIHNAA